ncbi:MAG: M1 family metallopeptidase [Flavobacteriales bacterium]
MPLYPSTRTSCLVAGALLISSLASAQTRSGPTGTAKGGGSALWPLDIIHQRITLDLTLGNAIAGHCTITAVPRTDALDHFPLDLLALTVDSVTDELGQMVFSHVGEVLDITLDPPLGTQDTIILTVHYHGDPVEDPSGFGGFYTSGSYIYDLGVAFESIPHSYGRSWFPCADNFTERNSYEFIVKTAGGKKAWCNGALLDETALGGDTLVRHWRIDETMPAYLASVAASNYEVVRDTFPSVSGGIVPVDLVARPADTTNMKNSFIHLPNAFAHFEDRFGAYRWNKVGFVLTPVGSMEHSTSIHFAQQLANGTLTYEATMAHELAHEWFGDLVTCDRPEEMYINEGFAEYLSYLFLEDVYGRSRYMQVVRANHRAMVHKAHLIDQGWWALAEMPQAWTYGEQTYNKGADVLHSLRTYVGDSLFDEGLTSFLDTYAFQPVNSIQLRDHLELVTDIPLTDFFDDWIFQSGWAAFGIRTHSFTQNGPSWDVHLTVQQKMRGPAVYYHNVPITVTIVGQDPANVQHTTVMVGDALTELTVPCSFEPELVWLNDDDGLSLAVTGQTDTITAPGTWISSMANFEIVSTAVPEPCVVRVEQYWVAPDQDQVAEPWSWIISPDRYWRISTHQLPPGCTGRLTFDGRNTTSGNLDPLLMGDTLGISFNEDSLVVLYRASGDGSWLEWGSTVNSLGSHTDGYGRITLDSLAVGEYTLAWRKSAVGIDENIADPVEWRILPNPAQDHMQLQWLGKGEVAGTVQLLDSAGRVVREERVQGTTHRFDLTGIAAGTCTLRFAEHNGPYRVIGRVAITR